MVLSRKPGESIVIGDSIVVTVVEVSRQRVRLGIEAPRTTTVHRREIYSALKCEELERRREACAPLPGDR